MNTMIPLSVHRAAAPPPKAVNLGETLLFNVVALQNRQKCGGQVKI